MDRITAVIMPVLLAAVSWCSEPAAGADSTHTLDGIVVELRSGTPDVPVCLCDGATGIPVSKETYEPFGWERSDSKQSLADMAIVVTDDRGRFRFEGVKEGRYRLIAQKWIGPYKGPFEEHGTVIQLMGVANDVVVPRPAEPNHAVVALTPPGRGIVQFDQDVGNSDTILLLSTAPPEFDPILGPSAMGKSFLRNLIGINRMPLGMTTAIGVPDKRLYGFFIAPDNSPGFATVEVPATRSGLARVPPEPFVAGWSNGRKTPPPALAELMKYLDDRGLSCDQLLDIPPLSNARFEAHQARMTQLRHELAREVELPGGRTARVGDLLAVKHYRRLQASARR